jgi:hypothetical protein
MRLRTTCIAGGQIRQIELNDILVEQALISIQIFRPEFLPRAMTNVYFHFTTTF